MDLDNFIKVIDQDLEEIFIKEVMYEHFTYYTIVIENLDITIKPQDDILILDLFSIEKPYSSKSFANLNKGDGMIHMEFKNNTFDTDDKINYFTNVCLGKKAFVIFNENTFNHTSLKLTFIDQEDTFVEFKNNTFKNYYVDISLPENDSKKSPAPLIKNNVVRIIDNRFINLNISGKINFFFTGKNKIESITSESTPFNIQWGRCQTLDKKSEHVASHKNLFLTLKADAIKKHDRFQELFFNREIMKLENKLLKKEEQDWSIYQDRFVLGIGWAFSDHGTSWSRPIYWLFGINSIYTIFICLLIYTKFDCWYIIDIFINFFNPLSNLDNRLEKAFFKLFKPISIFYIVIR